MTSAVCLISNLHHGTLPFFFLPPVLNADFSALAQLSAVTLPLTICHLPRLRYVTADFKSLTKLLSFLIKTGLHKQPETVKINKILIEVNEITV